MRNGKGGWWKRFCRFWESVNKREEPSERMEEVQSATDSDEESEFIFTDPDGNVIMPNGRKGERIGESKASDPAVKPG